MRAARIRPLPRPTRAMVGVPRDQAQDPRRVRLSKHFLLSDFLGNYSCYSRGYPNVFAYDRTALDKLSNVMALCSHGLEPIMEEWGPLSISYGYISPSLSRAIVKYQDPDKPSHHRFDLGAAADICVHDWVAGEYKTAVDLCLPESAQSSPIALAFGIDYIMVPYSRLITYSESPYICLAISAAEVEQGKPRGAFYENRFQGRPKVKPEYIQLSNPRARDRHFKTIQEQGLEHPWRGAGYPTHHGGGKRQYQHMRVSRYTMVSDWLFDLQSISKGCKNQPAFSIPEVQDAFAAAGIVYDWIIKTGGHKRLSIVQAYTSHLSELADVKNDWRKNDIHFLYSVSEEDKPLIESMALVAMWGRKGVEFSMVDGFIRVDIDVNTVLDSEDF